MSQLGMATTVGSLVGTAIGAVIGVGVGAATAMGSCALLMACLIIGLPIMATFAGVGGIAGTVVAGGGAMVAAGWDYLQTVQAAPFSTKYQIQLDQQKAHH